MLIELEKCVIYNINDVNLNDLYIMQIKNRK